MHNNKFILFILLAGMTTGTLALRDPTRPPPDILSAQFKKQAPENILTLQAIIESKSRRFAIINGKTLGVGDKIEGSEVIKIEKTRVHLKKGTTITVLSIVNQ